MSARMAVTLMDEVTGPARKMKTSIKGLTGAMDSIGDAAKKATAASGMFTDKMGRLRHANGRFATQAEKAAMGIRSMGSAATRTQGTMTSMIASGTMLGNIYTRIADLAGRAAMALGRFAIGAVSAIGKAAMFAEKTEMAFGFLTGSKSGGKAAFEEVTKLAVEYGLGVEATANSYKKLLAMQFKASQAKDIIKLGADMKALGNSQADIDGIVLAMSQIKAAGRLQGDELNQLAERGISIDLVYQNLAKNAGKSVEEIRKMKEAGKIPADMAIEAIKAAVKQKFHIENLGDASKKANKTIAGTYDLIKSRVEALKIELGKKLVPILQKHIMPLMQKFLGYLKSDGFSKVIDGVVAGFEALVVHAKKAVPLIQSFVSGLKSGLSGAKPFFEAFAKSFGAILGDKEGRDGLISFFRLLGQAAAVTAGSIAILGTVFNTLVSIQMRVYSGLAALYDLFAGFVGRLRGAGSSAGGAFSSGIASGILGGLSGVINAALSVARSAVSTVTGALQINSPSKVMAKIGAGIPEGTAQGIRQGTPMVRTASSQMSNAAVAGMGSRTVNQSVGGQTYNIHSNQSADDIAKAIAAEQEQFARQLEFMMLSAGT